MILLDGKKIAKDIKDELKAEIAAAVELYKKPIGLAVIMVGNNPASAVYVKNKVKDSEEVGIKSYLYALSEETTQEELISLIDRLNADPGVSGILVQLPLPKHLSEKEVLNRINTEKDVDGFSPYQMGKLVIGEPSLVACTPYGVMELLKRYNIDVSGMNAVIVGRSNIVGKPLFHLLLQANATVTVCHTKTKNLKEITAKADLLVAAVGRPKMITADMVKDGAVVVDVGINRVEDKLVGDVDFDAVAPKCSYITPVPGGVGLMTRAMLMANTLAAYKKQNA